VKKSREKITCGNFKALRKLVALTGVEGEWINGKNHCQFRTENGAVLNYWQTTGRIFFQGPKLPATELKVAIFKRALIIKQFDESGGVH
jgi:hypothetical protein